MNKYDPKKTRKACADVYQEVVSVLEKEVRLPINADFVPFVNYLEKVI
jgi:hypothetical protein